MSLADTTKEEPIVAVIADTHARRLQELPPEMVAAIKKADYVIHLGDYTSRELLDDLQELGTFHGIAGNHDDDSLRQELKDMKVVVMGGKRVGLIHGMVFPFGSQNRMRAWFKKHKVDIILYGHTHMPVNRRLGGVFMFNPGSATGQFPSYRSSFGLLSINGSISGEIFSSAGPHLNGMKPGFVKKFLAVVLGGAIRWVETWPYFDLLHHAASMWLVLKKFPARMGFLRRKTS